MIVVPVAGSLSFQKGQHLLGRYWGCIEDYEALPGFLESLGFDTVTFSYPKRAELGTSSLVYSESSSLIDFSPSSSPAGWVAWAAPVRPRAGP